MKKNDNMKKLGIVKYSDTYLKMKKSHDEFIQLMPLMLENNKINAEYKMDQYNQYLKAGFNKDQALELIK